MRQEKTITILDLKGQVRLLKFICSICVKISEELKLAVISTCISYVVCVVELVPFGALESQE